MKMVILSMSRLRGIGLRWKVECEWNQYPSMQSLSSSSCCAAAASALFGTLSSLASRPLEGEKLQNSPSAGSRKRTNQTLSFILQMIKMNFPIVITTICRVNAILSFLQRLHSREYNNYRSMLQNRRNWSDYEDKAILSLVKKHGTKNWAEISQKMVSKYGIETRTGKQCRERWHNHLNPQVNKNAWTQKEEKAMFQAHQVHGNKWTQIAKQFPGRTDNDIKNHFYSMLRRSLRRVNKLLGMRNSTQKIRLIKPSVLSNIFSNSTNDDHAADWKQISQALFEFSKAKSVDELSNGLEESEKHKLEDLIEKIAYYNDEYEQSQLEKKESRRQEKQKQKEREKSREENEDMKEEVAKKQDVSDNPVLKKKASSTHSKSSKTKKIKRLPKMLKKSSKNSQQPPAIKKQSNVALKRGRKKKDPLTKLNESTNTQQSTLPPPPLQLRKRESQLSFKFGEQISIPDLMQLPELDSLSKKRSSCSDSRRVSSSHSSSFFNSTSPRMDLRIFTRTPQGPTPNLADMLSRNLINYQWKANNEELDDIVTQTQRAIARKTNR